MNPVIIIPTYCSSNRFRENTDVLSTYDHMTPLSLPGELPRCLASLRDNDIRTPVIILVVSQKGYESEAAVKIKGLAGAYPELDIRVAGGDEYALFANRAEEMGIGNILQGVSLDGYGAVRNFGLALAMIGGFDAAIFIDDDEVVETSSFVERACYGLGKLSPSGIPIFAKTGFFINKDGSTGFNEKPAWYDKYWPTVQQYNNWLEGALRGARLSRSSAAFGGCLALHREAFCRVSFDPFITRGEDTDYLINMRLYGSEIWLDNQWCIKHLPPEGTEVTRFRQDIYRWLYEGRKLEYSRAQIDLNRVTPESLMPYPGSVLGSNIQRKVFLTALLRALGRRQHTKGYFRAAMEARKEASNYAMEKCSCYFDFQYMWPEACSLMSQDPAMKNFFSGERQYGESAGLTGTFQAVSMNDRLRAAERQGLEDSPRVHGAAAVAEYGSGNRLTGNIPVTKSGETAPRSSDSSRPTKRRSTSRTGRTGGGSSGTGRSSGSSSRGRR